MNSSVLSRVKVAAINIHRGALPAYAGAEPVRRAIEAGETRVAITAHHMTEKLDEGPVIAEVWMGIDLLPSGETSASYAGTIRQRLEPLYSPLTLASIAAVIA